jgi:hypothetical protein
MRILYLSSQRWYEQKMDRTRVLNVEAVRRQPSVNLHIWGNGWPDYVEGELLEQNIRRRGIEYPDLVWCFKANEHKGVAEFPRPKAIELNDCYDAKIADEVRAAAPSLVVYHHENDWQSENMRDGARPGCDFIHVPHCADKAVFYREGDWDRPIDCLFAGALHETIYPLRSRYVQLIKGGAIPGEVRRFPGHRTRTAGEGEAQHHSFSNHLRRSKVALCCSSTYKYALSKYVEAIAAGCVVVGDMPDDQLFRDTLGRALVEVNNSMADDQIMRIVKETLADPAELERRREFGYAEYLAAYTTEHWARRFLEAASRVV